MLASVAWINRLISPDGLDAAAVEHALTDAGLPIESREQIAGGDTRLDVEVTSNRGDCLCHVGIAREVAAKVGRTLNAPPVPILPQNGAATPFTLENRAPDVCPRFTARVITGVTVGPSPAWLRTALESIGQRSISNVVDVTNFLAAELGNPAHVFDLDRLAGKRLIVRYANEGEPLRTLDGRHRTLRRDELVVADGERAQSLAGVIGGADSEVSAHTANVVLEVATWDPVTIRRAARRLGIRTEAGHRFERIVDPRTVADASDRAAAMILELAGGSLAGPRFDEGRPLRPLSQIVLRPARVTSLLGAAMTSDEIEHHLHSIGATTERAGDEIRCVVPAWRPDLTRECDLIEEVARLRGLGAIPLLEKLPVRVTAPQQRERAVEEAGRVLAGLGFFETVTFSFVPSEHAAVFRIPGVDLLRVSGERRVADPILRPSAIAGLLACRRANEDAGAAPSGGVRLFEIASAFGHDSGANRAIEHRNLSLLIDVAPPGSAGSATDHQDGLRRLRGAVEAVVRALRGDASPLSVIPGAPPWKAFEPDASAGLRIGDEILGVMGLVSAEGRRAFGVETGVAAAELSLELLVRDYPPRTRLTPLPEFPGIARDISFVVPDATPWSAIEQLIRDSSLARLEGAQFVTTFRGPQIGAGRKSVTARLRFRDPERTLRREDADAEIERLIQKAKSTLGADVRSA